MNAVANDLDPFLRGICQPPHVADVEMPPHPLAIDRVEVLHGLFGGHDEIVSDILNRDLHAELLRHGNGLFDFHDGTVETLFVGDAKTDDAGRMRS